MHNELIFSDKREDKKENPYEMLKLGGKWLGIRYPCRNIKARELRFEIFLDTPEEIRLYIDDCTHESYFEIEQAFKTHNPIEEEYIGMEFLWAKCEFIGAYYMHRELNRISVRVTANPLKLNQKIVYEIMRHVQNIAKSLENVDIININIDTDKKFLPQIQNGLKTCLVLNYFNYNITFFVSTPIEGTFESEEFHVSNNAQDSSVTTCSQYPSFEGLLESFVDLKDKMDFSSRVTLSLRDDDNKFMAAIIIKSSPYISKLVEVESLYVSPEIQGCGIGSGLLWLVEVCMQRIGLNNIIACTASYMSPKFYEKLGYKQISSNATKYGDIADLLFSKTLTSPNEVIFAPKLRSF
jgi:ribosomal protein S18 acetylase RimI-like enzyme